MNQRLTRLAAGSCLAASAIFGLAGCSFTLTPPSSPASTGEAQSTSGSSTSGSSTSGSSTTGASADPGVTENVFEIHSGDCFTLPNESTDQISDVTVLPCSEPHQFEAYAEITMTGSAYPGEDELQRQGDEGCGPKFESWVSDTSQFSYSFIPPSRQSWEQANDRIILCVAQSIDENETSGSAGK